MNILTWGGGNAPPTHAWCARFQVGKHILPPIIYAATEEAVIAKAQAFWDSETEKARNRMAGKHHRPQTTEERICERGKPTEIEGEDDPVLVETRYFYHPESDSLMISIDGSHPGTDGLVEEIDRETYASIAERHRQGEVAEAHTKPTTDDLDDLLG